MNHMTRDETHLKHGGAARRDESFMRKAIRLARIAFKRGDTPVGSVVVYKGHIVGKGIESVRSEKDLAAHAELKGIKEACRRLDTLRLAGCELYTTAEPCFMCSFVIRTAQLSRVVIGKPVPYIGGISSHYPILIDSRIPNWPRPPAVVSGVLEKECKALFVR
jgi:tRNA(adenine34) deaminase